MVVKHENSVGKCLEIVLKKRIKAKIGQKFDFF